MVFPRWQEWGCDSPVPGERRNRVAPSVSTPPGTETRVPRALPGALTGPCPHSLTQRWLCPSSGDPLVLGDAHFTMEGLNAFPRLTP